MARTNAVFTAGAAGGRGDTATGRGQPGPEQAIGDPPSRGGLEFVAEGTVAQQRRGTEQPFDLGQRTGTVTVVEPFANARQRLRTTVRPVDDL